MKVKEMEQKVSIEIGAVKAMMLHRFSEVDQKLVAIEHLLKKVIEKENDIGMTPETGNSDHENVIKKDIGEVKLGKDGDEGKKVVIGEGNDGTLPGAEKSMQAVNLPDGDVQETNNQTPRPKVGILWGDWVSRDCGNSGWQGPPWELRVGDERRWPKYGPDFGIERDYCIPDWVCHREHGFGKENGPCAGFGYRSHEGFGLKVVKANETGLGGKKSENESGIVKGGQDEIAKDSLKTDGLGTEGSSGALGKDADDTEARAGTLRNEMNTKSGVVESVKGGNKTQTQAVTENTKKPVLQGQKDQKGCCPKGKQKKIKCPNKTVGVPNDGPKVSTPVTATGERMDLFTSDEQEILADIEPIMHSIHKIMHQNGYNDGDPLSADDQTYILDNVFNHHPERAQKMGDGVDYIMVMRNQESPCFYIVLNGNKEEFSHRECLANFIRGKYPNKVDRFVPKYFKEPKPYPPRKRDRGSDPDEVGTLRSQSRLKHESNDEVKTPLFPSGFNLKLNVVTDKSGTPCARSGLNTDASVATDEVATPVFRWNKEGVAPTSGWNMTGSVLFQEKNLSLEVADGGQGEVSKDSSVGKLKADVAADSWRTELAARLDSVAFDKGSKQPKALVSTKGSNRKGHEESEKQGSFGQKNQQGCGPKRKRPNLSAGVLSDYSRSSGQMMVQVQLANEPPPNEITTKSGSIESDKGDYKHQAQVSSEDSNVKGYEESEKPGSGVWKNQEGSPKRKCTDWLNWPVKGPNDCVGSSGRFTVTRQWLDVFTSDEQEILTDIEPIMQSIQRIMFHNGYNDGDPLSADDQTYLLDNVFNHHSEKARKLGAGVDYITVTKNIKFQEDRCFYVVLDGCKEELSYRECLENYVREKYPDKVDVFIPKYFKEPRPSHIRNEDRGSCSDEVTIPLFQSGWGLDFSNFSEKIFKSVSIIP